MKRLYYYIELKNISPIHVGNGDNSFTDIDLIKDKQGNFYIPGSSIAGSISHYLQDAYKEYKDLFNPNDVQSPVFISDAFPEATSTKVEMRTGVELENKLAKDTAKFDYEIVPAGYIFKLRIEITDRHNQEEQYKELMNIIMNAIQSKDIRLGYKTTRGFGCLSIEKVKMSAFDQSNFNEYFSFDKYDEKSYKEEIKLEEAKSILYTKVRAVLKQNGGISIRTYNTHKEDVDFEHIRSNDKPVIPGTSWNGLIRATLLKYVKELKIDLNMNEIFGHIEKKTKNATKSKVIISESELKDGIDKRIVRNRISAFHGGTVNSALYDEYTHYNADTELEIMIEHDFYQTDLILMLIVMFFNDLHNGIVALGGQTSIGRGLFTVKSLYINEEEIDLNDNNYVREV